jgi:hypothetical protein
LKSSNQISPSSQVDKDIGETSEYSLVAPERTKNTCNRGLNPCVESPSYVRG